jgi:dihydroneopterin triphosphate aldolase (PTPS-III) / 6-pyruvoyltetrahydropterin synthase
VSNDTFKFNAAHFVAYPNYRERIHGHNYRVHVKLIGSTCCPDRSCTASSSCSNHTTNTAILGVDGYLMDFTLIKRVMKQICRTLNEHFIVPLYSTVLTITTITLPASVPVNKTKDVDEMQEDEMNTTSLQPPPSTNAPPPQPEQVQEYIHIQCHMDKTQFTFPKQDCILLPIVHSTAEELAIYIYCQMVQQMSVSYFQQRHVQIMEIAVQETPGQQATFRHAIPEVDIVDDNECTNPPAPPFSLDVRHFIQTGNVIPIPCLAVPVDNDNSNVNVNVDRTSVIPLQPAVTPTRTNCCSGDGGCCNGCLNAIQQQPLWQQQLQQIVQAMNDGRLLLSTSPSDHNTTTTTNTTTTDNPVEGTNHSTTTTRPKITVQDLEQLLALTTTTSSSNQ